MIHLLLSCLGLVALIYNAIPSLIHPSFFMDEALYLGATQAMLKGDFFLTQYGFDKSFFLPFWPLLGILSFGNTALGFRFVAFICMCISYFVFLDLLKIITQLAVRKNVNILSSVLSVVFALIFFSLPAVRLHYFSAFCEPYLMLGVLLLSRAALIDAPAPKVARIFFPFFFTKYSMLLWFPMLWRRHNLDSIRKFFSWHFQFVKLGKFWLALFLIFSLTNSVKFATITWFQVMMGNGAVHPPLWVRLSSWYQFLADNFSNRFEFYILLVAFLGTAALLYRRKSFKLLWVLVGAFMLHFLSLIFLNALLYSRYTLLLLPVFFITAFYFIQVLANKSFLLKAPLILLFAFVAGLEFKMPPQFAENSVLPGRNMSLIDTEIDSSSAMLFTNRVWESAPYRKLVKTWGCITPDCILSSRHGAEINAHQYYYDGLQKPAPLLLRAPLYLSEATKLKTNRIPEHKVSDVQIPMDLQVLKGKILAALKLKKAVLESSLEIVNDPLSAQGTQAELPEVPIEGLNHWKPLFMGPSFKLEGTLKKSPLQGEDHIIIEGRFGVNDLKKDDINESRYSLVYQITSARWGSREVTDVIPLLLRSYAFTIDALPVKWSNQRSIETLNYDSKLGTFHAKILTFTERL